MKSFGIVCIIAILLLFGTPLIEIKDRHQNMEYTEIGETMLGNVENYIDFLNTTGETANSVVKIIKDIKDFISSIADFVKELFEHETGQTCTGDYENGWSCGSSEGGGGGSMGGR